MLEKIILIIVALLSLILSGIFAGSETAMYQLSRLRLRLGIEKKQAKYIRLEKIMLDSQGLLISNLIANNLTHYIVTSTVTVLLLSRFRGDQTIELFTTAVTAPVLFVFAELIPKNVFYYRADLLMPHVSGLLLAFKKINTWCGAIPFLKKFTQFVGKGIGTASPSETMISISPKSHIKTIIQETREEGFLSTVQTNIINRLSGVSHMQLKSVMTPISKAQTVEVDSDRAALLTKLKKSPRTRLLVYENSPTNILGVINIYQCLEQSQSFTNLQKLIEPIRKLHTETTVLEAISIMQKEKQRIVMVTSINKQSKTQAIGIVTMKDLVEELVGELAEW